MNKSTTNLIPYFTGYASLASAFQLLVQAAEQTLGLHKAKRFRTLLGVSNGR